ncbi:MAG: type II secretion system F family protein [Deltaproteobacteria bacterium]|nr:type II secretion system F family protein [Deltaproteobacteria bacterium]
MPTFRYKAYDSGGKPVAGNIEAAGIKDAVQLIKNTGLFPADVSEAEFAGGRFFNAAVSSQALTLTTRQLATLLSTGTALPEALLILTNNTDNARLRSILINIKESVAGGSSLTTALAPYPDVFSPFYKGLVTAGEASGSLDKALLQLADYLEARAKIVSEVKAALTYPALMCFVGAAILSFLFAFVIPKITRIFDDTKNMLPLITKVLLALTGIVKSYWPAIIIGTGGSIWLARRYVRTPKGKTFSDRLLLELPWFGKLASDFYISNFTRTLGSLLKSGVQLLKALEITREVLNHAVYDKILDTAITDCTGGTSLSASLKKHKAIPQIVTHMISVGERSGSLDDMLIKTAETYTLDFERGVKRAMNLLEPLLILAMGVIVGFIVLAILLPIFELNQIIH